MSYVLLKFPLMFVKLADCSVVHDGIHGNLSSYPDDARINAHSFPLYDVLSCFGIDCQLLLYYQVI